MSKKTTDILNTDEVAAIALYDKMTIRYAPCDNHVTTSGSVTSVAILASNAAAMSYLFALVAEQQEG